MWNVPFMRKDFQVDRQFCKSLSTCRSMTLHVHRQLRDFLTDLKQEYVPIFFRALADISLSRLGDYLLEMYHYCGQVVYMNTQLF